MANVAGVGQLLETVGVPAAQVGTPQGGEPSGAGTDFASALQQAGGPSAQEVAGPVVKSGDKAPEDTASGNKAASTGKMPSAGVSDQEPARWGVVAQPAVGGAGLGLHKGVAVTAPLGSKLGEAASVTPLEMGVAAVPRVETGTKSAVPVVSLSGTVPDIAVAAPVRETSAAVPPTAAVKSAEVPAKVAAKASDEAPVETAAKPAGRSEGKMAAIDSKLTALVPQGVVDVSQTPTPALPMTAAVVAPAIAEPVRASSKANVPVVGAAPVVARAGAAVQAGSVPRAPAQSSGVAEAASSGLAAEAIHAQASAAPAAKSEGAAMPAEPVAKVAGAAAKVAAAPMTDAPPVTPVAQPALAAAPSLTEAASAALQSGVPAAGLIETPVVKPGAPGGRSAGPAVKPVEAPVVAGSAPAAVQAKQPVAAAAAVPVKAPAVPVAGADPKAEFKAVDVPSAAVQVAPMTAKAAAPAEIAAATKGSETAGHSASAAPPAPVTAEPVAVVTAAMPVLVPVTHETAGSTVAGSTVAAAGAAGVSSAAVATPDVGLAHTTLNATPTSLEVGVSSGTHGWLKIRAELNDAGTVDASLTGTSLASAERLRTELPGLTNFLQNERVAMGSLDVRSALHSVAAAAESGATFSQTGSGQGSSGQGSAGQSFSQANANGAAVSADAGSAGGRAQQQAPQGGDTVPGVGAVDEVVLGRVSDAALYGSSMELGDNAAASSVGYGVGGGWLNVRA